MRIGKFFVIVSAALLLRPEVCSAQTKAAAPDPTDAGEVVVRAYPPHCHPGNDDPQDQVDLSAAAGRAEQQVIKLDHVSGRYILTSDDYPTTAPGVWQRDGTRLHEFVFRVPKDGNPLCIGTRTSKTLGLANCAKPSMPNPIVAKFCGSPRGSPHGR